MLSWWPLPFLTPESQAIIRSSHHLQTLTPSSSHHICFIPQFHFTGHSSQLEPKAGLSLPRRGSAAPCDHVAQTCQGTQGLSWPSQPPCSSSLQKQNRRPLSSGSFACPPLSPSWGIPGPGIFMKPFNNSLFKEWRKENSPEVQWLGLGTFTARARIWSLVRELKSNKPLRPAKKKKKKMMSSPIEGRKQK